MLDGAKLTGILDWEFAGWGDPHEDIGWFCCKGWRFARLDREAGGIAGRAPFYSGYEGASGRAIDPATRLLLGGAGERPMGDYCVAAKRPVHDRRRAQPGCRIDRAARHRMRARDTDAARSRWSPCRCVICRRGPTLLGLARDIVAERLLPLLPPEPARRAARRQQHGDRRARGRGGASPGTGDPPGARGLYADAPSPTQLCRLASPLPQCGRGCSSAARRVRAIRILRRFARDLRAGAFGGSERQARDILWRLTIGKLRLANPRFLAANGFR